MTDTLVKTTPARIVVRFTQDGLHHWPQAPAPRAYLGVPHRHLFHIAVGMTVEHDNREIEFHDLMDSARAALSTLDNRVYHTLADFGARSCEAIARELAVILVKEFKRSLDVTVSEDGEVEAMVAARVG